MGAFKSVIMSVLGLITPQDLKYLTEASREKILGKKLAAGAEGWEWENDSIPRPEARVIPFPQRGSAGPDSESIPGREFAAKESPLEALGVLPADKQAELKRAAALEYERSKPAELDLVLSERERFRSSEERIFKQNGLQSYRKNSDLRMYRVSIKDPAGKEKTKITSTLGVLVDKKQA